LEKAHKSCLFQINFVPLHSILKVWHKGTKKADRGGGNFQTFQLSQLSRQGFTQTLTLEKSKIQNPKGNEVVHGRSTSPLRELGCKDTKI